MTAKMKKIKLIFLLFLLSSCYGIGNKETLNLFFDDVKLNTTSLEIVKTYGVSSKRWEDKSGNNVVSYSYSKPKYNILSFLPWQKTTSQFVNYEVILVFDQKGNLIKFAKFNDQLQTKSWLLCEENVANCDK